MHISPGGGLPGPGRGTECRHKRGGGCWEQGQGATKDHFLSEIFLRRGSLFLHSHTANQANQSFLNSYIVLSFSDTDFFFLSMSQSLKNQARVLALATTALFIF